MRTSPNLAGLPSGMTPARAESLLHDEAADWSARCSGHSAKLHSTRCLIASVAAAVLLTASPMIVAAALALRMAGRLLVGGR